MYAHRIRITVPESHEITVRLPSDVPPGEAELIVLTEAPPHRVPPSVSRRGSIPGSVRCRPPPPSRSRRYAGRICTNEYSRSRHEP